jgi:hypothetical protein
MLINNKNQYQKGQFIQYSNYALQISILFLNIEILDTLHLQG